jgi:hypothetical protein
MLACHTCTPAGTGRMPWAPFMLVRVTFATLWCTFLLVCSMKLHEHWHVAQLYFHQMDIVIVVVLVANSGLVRLFAATASTGKCHAQTPWFRDTAIVEVLSSSVSGSGNTNPTSATCPYVLRFSACNSLVY